MEFYNKAAESVEEKEIKEILRHLAQWEKVHRDRIYDLYQKLSKDFWEHMETDPIF
jgi:rubrerythrin